MKANDSQKLARKDIWLNWVSPRRAVLTVAPLLNGSEDKAVAWLRRRLDFGQLYAIALSFCYVHDSEFADAEFAIIPTNLWPELLNFSSDDDFWVSGDYVKLPNQFQIGNQSECVLTGARFNPLQLAELLKAQDIAPVLQSEKSNQPQAPNQSKGGRPLKPFWDRLWATIAAQLYNGDLTPGRQADIEDAMHKWLIANDEDAGETAIRVRAKLLWTAIQIEDKN